MNIVIRTEFSLLCYIYQENVRNGFPLQMSQLILTRQDDFASLGSQKDWCLSWCHQTSESVNPWPTKGLEESFLDGLPRDWKSPPGCPHHTWLHTLEQTCSHSHIISDWTQCGDTPKIDYAGRSLWKQLCCSQGHAHDDDIANNHARQLRRYRQLQTSIPTVWNYLREVMFDVSK